MLPVGVRPRQLSGPHPAGRHVPGPGRSPARPPDPGAPGADRLPEDDQRRLGVIADWKHGPHLLTYRQTECTFGLVADALGKDEPDGLPRRPAAGASAMTCSRPRIPEEFKDASRSLAVDWTDLESFSRPPPRGTSDCADPEASWGHRKNNLLRSQDELFYGYYLSAGIMMPEENGPAVPELARRATLSSCRHDPVRAFAPVLTAMPGQRDPARRHPRRLRLRPPRRRRLGHPAARRRRAARPGPAPARPRPQGHPRRRHHRQREPVLPAHTPPAAGTRAARPHRHQRAGRGPRPQDQPSWPATSSAASPPTTPTATTASQCPAAMGKIRCPLRPASMTLDRDRPEILQPPGAPPGLLRPADHHRPAGRARQDRAETRLPVRGLAPLLRPPHRRRTRLRHRQGPRHQRHQPAAGAASWAWHPSCCSPRPCSIVRNQRILAAWNARQEENQRRAAAGLPPRTRRRRRKTLASLAAAGRPSPATASDHGPHPSPPPRQPPQPAAACPETRPRAHSKPPRRHRRPRQARQDTDASLHARMSDANVKIGPTET